MAWWQEFFYIFNWSDVVEIGILSGIVYAFSRWCARDRHTPLLLYFYACCAGGIAASFFNLPTLTAVIYMGWPALVIIFVIVHQHTLQKNYIAGKTIIPAQRGASTAWVPLLLRAGIRAAVQRKTVVFVVQGSSVLDDFIEDFLVFNSPVNKELLDLLVESTHIKNFSLMLVNQQGIMRAMNGRWREGAQELWIDRAIAVTAHTDALVWAVDLDSRLFTIVAQGARVEQLASDKAEAIIMQYVRKQNLVQKSKAHEHINQKDISVS